MLIVVDSSGTILPAATIVWGPGVVATHRGNNVWRVSNLLAASEVADLATVIQSVTKERTVIRPVTRPVTSFLTRTVTQQPWVTRTVTATLTQIQWNTVGSVIGGTRTHTHVIGTRTRTATHLNTSLFTVTQTRPVTVSRTATRWVTKVVTVTAAAAGCPDNCDACPEITVVISGMANDTCSLCSTLAGGQSCQDIVGMQLVKFGCGWSAAALGGVTYDIRCTDGWWYLTVYQAVQHPYATPCAQWRQAASACPPLDANWVWVGGCCDGSGATVTTS